MHTKLIYIANIRLPTEKAHGIQIMEMCSAFADQGCQVELVVPNRRNPIQEDPFVYHDVKKNFSIRKLPMPDFLNLGRVGYFFQYLWFSESVSWYALPKKNTLFYTRDELVALYLKIMGKKVMWEAHQGQKNIVIRLLILLRAKIVTITEALKNLYVSIGIRPELIFVAPDGADLDRFNIHISKETARKGLNLPLDKKIVLYTGHLYSWKGANLLAESTKEFPNNTLAVFIGGTGKDIIDFKMTYGRSHSNVLILGVKLHKDVPRYLRAADVLVIPNSAKQDISRLYTSPLKLFEYMTSDRPIVASDLPSLREILDESRAYFFIPDDSKSLAKVINQVLDNYDEAMEKAHSALLLAGEYSWQNRAKSILEFSN